MTQLQQHQQGTTTSLLSPVEAPKREALTDAHLYMDAERIGKWSSSTPQVCERWAERFSLYYGLEKDQVPPLEKLFRKKGGNPKGRQAVFEVLQRKYLATARKHN